MLRQSKRGTISPPSTPRRSASLSEVEIDRNANARYVFPRRRLGFWNNPMNAVAIFAGSFAFAASLTLGVMNAARDTGSVWRRLLMGKTNTLAGLDATMLLREASPTQPFLVMGLPKSGSEAIHNYFACNKIRSSHYCCDAGTKSSSGNSEKSSRKKAAPTKFPCGDDQVTCGSCVLNNMQKERPPLEGCGDYQVWSQFDVETTEPFSWFLPQHHALPLLREAYPNAAIILNRRRNAEDWAKSILHWHSKTTRLFESFDLDLIKQEDLSPEPKEVSYETLVEDMQSSLNRVMSNKEWKRKRNLLMKVYEEHTDKVKQFADQHNIPLLEVIVDDPSQGLIFSEMFRLSPKCWKFNATEYENDWRDFSLPF